MDSGTLDGRVRERLRFGMIIVGGKNLEE